MKKLQSGDVSDEFWARVEPLIPKRQRDADKIYQSKSGGGFILVAMARQLLAYDELEGITWEWQSLDGAMVKAPLALESVGRNPTDRGKKGSI